MGSEMCIRDSPHRSFSLNGARAQLWETKEGAETREEREKRQLKGGRELVLVRAWARSKAEREGGGAAAIRLAGARAHDAYDSGTTHERRERRERGTARAIVFPQLPLSSHSSLSSSLFLTPPPPFFSPVSSLSLHSLSLSLPPPLRAARALFNPRSVARAATLTLVFKRESSLPLHPHSPLL